MIKCETTIGKSEQNVITEVELRAVKSNKIKQIITTVFLFCAAAFFLFFGFCGFLSEGMTFLAARVFIYGVIFLVWAILNKRVWKSISRIKHRRMEKRMARQMRRAETADDGRREYTFTDDDVVVTSYLGEFRWKWDAIMTYGDIDHYLYIMTVNRGLIIVDKNTMTGEELRGLYDLLRRKMV